MQELVRLVSLAVLNDSDEVIAASNEKLLKMYKDCGFLRYEKLESDYNIVLKEDGAWFLSPPELKMIQKKERQEYCPRELEDLCKVLGFPIDFYSNLGKYRKLYLALAKKYDKKQIMQTADFAAKENKEMTLNLFLTAKAFEAAKQAMENPKKPVFKDRVSSTDYNEEAGF